MKQLLAASISLLDSGDDDGCEDLVVVGRYEFLKLRRVILQLTGQWCGSITEDDSGE